MKDREKLPHRYAYAIAYDYAHLGEYARAPTWLATCLQENSCNLLTCARTPAWMDCGPMLATNQGPLESCAVVGAVAIVARLFFLFRFACSHSSADTAPIFPVQ